MECGQEGKRARATWTISRGNVRSTTAGRGVAWVLMEKKWKQWRPGKEEEKEAAAWGKELRAMA